MNLAEHVEITFGKESGILVDTFFSKLSLPLPENGEYSRSYENGYLTFMSPRAVTLRITPKKHLEPVRIPGTLGPLVSTEDNTIKIDLNPGIKCPVQHRDVRKLYQDFKKSGLWLWDAKTQNCGYIKLPGSKNSVPIVIDPCAVARLSNAVRPLKRYMDIYTRLINFIKEAETTKDNSNWVEESSEVDRVIFEDLRHFAKKAFENRRASRTGDVAKFGEECRLGMRTGLLVAGWDDNPKIINGNYKKAGSSSKAYAQRLQDQAASDFSFLGAIEAKSSAVSPAVSTAHIPTV